jgi:hypothetical protein
MGCGDISGNAGLSLICSTAACDRLGEYPARSNRSQVVHRPAPRYLFVRLDKDRKTGGISTIASNKNSISNLNENKPYFRKFLDRSEHQIATQRVMSKQKSAVR